MRRLMKEQLVKFDGTALFPPRYAYVVPYDLSGPEAALYEQVTTYVREEMNRAERLKAEGEGKRGLIVGFALTVLQRRLASSPAAIHMSLKRRLARLERTLAETLLQRDGAQARISQPELDAITIADIEEIDDDEATAEEAEAAEETAVDLATAASTIAELRLEIERLKELEALAAQVRKLGTDTKWTELSTLLQEEPEMRDAGGGRRKLIIFTEHRDTLDYLVERIGTFLGRPEAIVAIHGGLPRDQRRAAESAFKNDPAVVVLVATDAAGEGINLQRAHLMVNYDLPWNPNRIEQRFGRIHRIGQTEAVPPVEPRRPQDPRGRRLRPPAREARRPRRRPSGAPSSTSSGEVTFEGKPLRHLLIEAIRLGDSPEVRTQMTRVIDEALDVEHLRALLATRALGAEPPRHDQGRRRPRRARTRRGEPAPAPLRPRLLPRRRTGASAGRSVSASPAATS